MRATVWSVGVVAACCLSLLRATAAAPVPGAAPPSPPPCAADGTCYINAAEWGYSVRRWRRWPGDVGVSLPDVDLTEPQFPEQELERIETPAPAEEDRAAPPLSEAGQRIQQQAEDEAGLTPELPPFVLPQVPTETPPAQGAPGQPAAPVPGTTPVPGVTPAPGTQQPGQELFDIPPALPFSIPPGFLPQPTQPAPTTPPAGAQPQQPLFPFAPPEADIDGPPALPQPLQALSQRPLPPLNITQAAHRPATARLP